MHITKLKVMCFEGLESLEVEPGAALNLVEGRNGAGKTSVLEAIRVAFTNRGQRSMLVHADSDNGLILFELSDGTEGQRDVNRKGYTAGDVTLYRDGEGISSAQTFLNSIGLGFGFNPLSFIELRPDQQTERLLEVTPVNLGRDDLLALTNGVHWDSVDYDAHPLKVLDQIKDALVEQRRVVGRDARDTEGMVEKLRAKVPDDFDREAIEDFDLPDAVRKMRQSRSYRERVASLDESIQAKGDRIVHLERQIEDLRAGINALELEREKAVQLVDATEDPAAIESRIEVYQENQDHLQNLKQADEREAEAEALREQYSELQDMISKARAMPGRVLSNTELPVEGLGIDDGSVTINGLPISELSTGEQLKVAVDIALATLGELKVVLVDGLEKLDPDNRALLLDRLSSAGVQAFITDISDGELEIITDYAAGDYAVVEAEDDDFDPDSWLELDGSEAPF